MATIEETVRAEFARMGLTPDRLGAEECEQEIRREVDRLELKGSTPLVSVSSAMKTPKFQAAVEAASERPNRPLEVLRPFEEFHGACEVCNDARWVRIADNRDDARFGHTIPCPACVPMEQRLAWAGVPEQFRAMTVEQMRHLPGKRAALEFVSTWRGESAVLHADARSGSRWGTGKTQLAVLLARRAIEHGMMPTFTSALDLFASIRNTFGADAAGDARALTAAVVEGYATAPLLIIDDLGAERPTDWTFEQVRYLIDARYSNSRPYVITTNATGPDELVASVGGAVASRLKDATWVAVGGVDMRGAR